MKNEKPIEVKHPYHDCTTKNALDLGKMCKYGPNLDWNTQPDLTIDEAIEAIQNSPSWKAFNWITGQTAVQVLKASKGEKVDWT